MEATALREAWVLVCRTALPRSLNRLSQPEQPKGFSPVCTRSWIASLLESGQCFPQYPQTLRGPDAGVVGRDVGTGLADGVVGRRLPLAVHTGAEAREGGSRGSRESM